MHILKMKKKPHTTQIIAHHQIVNLTSLTNCGGSSILFLMLSNCFMQGMRNGVRRVGSFYHPFFYYLVETILGNYQT